MTPRVKTAKVGVRPPRVLAGRETARAGREAGRETARDGGSIWIVGRGKVGVALARAARAAGLEIRCLGSRAAVPKRSPDLLVLAVSDGAVGAVGERWAKATSPPTAIVHTAGLLGPGHLEPLRRLGWKVGQAHPLLSFVGAARTDVAGATMLVDGDPMARRRAAAFARRLGMLPVSSPTLDRSAWHAVAALVANGAAALVAVGKARWVEAGVPAPIAERALAALLASVARNVATVGVPRALSGPVRRGDVGAVQRHLAALGGGGDLAYAALVRAQIPLARALAEAPAGSLDAIEAAAAEVLAGPALPKPPRRRPA